MRFSSFQHTYAPASSPFIAPSAVKLNFWVCTYFVIVIWSRQLLANTVIPIWCEAMLCGWLRLAVGKVQFRLEMHRRLPANWICWHATNAPDDNGNIKQLNNNKLGSTARAGHFNEWKFPSLLANIKSQLKWRIISC